MLAIRLPVELEQRLDALSKRTGRSKSYYVRAAIVDYLSAVDGSRVAEPRGAYAVQSSRKRGPEDRPLQLTAVLLPAEEGGFVAVNPETGTTSQGEAIADALANLREATSLYLEEFPLPSYGKALLTTFDVKGRGS
jgi:predicted RNase H-like HicB family nuclease